jgi:hypothetical protein
MMAMSSPTEIQMKSNVLEIISQQEHALLVEQDITDESKLMYPAFQAALMALDGILTTSDEWNEKRETKNYNGLVGTNSFSDANNLYGYSNNILAFCAARGQGKTSAMLSFSRALSNLDYIKNKNSYVQDVFQADTPYKRKFYVLPPIDPTMLGAGDSVVELVLSRILDDIQQKWKESPEPYQNRIPSSVHQVSRIDLLDKINTCLVGLRSAKPKNYQLENMTDTEKLARSTDAFDVKQCFFEIIQYLFHTIGWDGRNHFLVIQLDDTDMQFENAYNILEEVRKYFSIPNVVVLMATYLKQLSSLVELHYRKVLGDRADAFDPAHMAAKYIDKLIPASQMIHLPSVKRQWETSVKPFVTIKSDEKEIKTVDLEQLLFKLIFDKTGLLFIRHETYIHDIVPSTLRGVSHLYRLLERMEAPGEIPAFPETFEIEELSIYCEKYLNYSNTLLNNLLLLENYFMNDWCASRLAAEQRDILGKLEHTNLTRRIDYMINYIKECWNVNCSSSNYIPYVELLCYLDHLQDKYITTDEDYRFVFAIHTFFSIQMKKLVATDQIASLNIFKRKLKGQNSMALNVECEQKPVIEYNHLAKFLCGTKMKTGTTNADRMIATVRGAFTYHVTSKKQTHKTEYPVRNELRKCTFDIYRFLDKISNILVRFQLDLMNYDISRRNDAKIYQEHSSHFQEYVLYFCSNWEVQHQLFTNMTFAVDDASANTTDYPNIVSFFHELRDLLKKKDAVYIPDENGQNGNKDGRSFSANCFISGLVSDR